jgi:NADH:ubiquinone oxidoreductase subunit K
MDSLNIFLLSGTLFCIGFISLLKQTDLVKTIISIEIMQAAGVINFCYFAKKYSTMSGYLVGMVAIILSGLVFAIIFMILNLQANEDGDPNLLKEDT